MAHTNEEHAIIMGNTGARIPRSTLDISRTPDGEANWIVFCNAFCPDGAPVQGCGDLVNHLWDSSWIVKKVTYDF